MTAWDDLKADVELNGNVLTVTMERLRNATGANRLGVHVRSEISNTLAGIGLDHVPQELPGFQHEQVRLFKRGTLVGDLIATVLAPGERADKILTEQHGGSGLDHAAVIEKIRELVVE